MWATSTMLLFSCKSAHHLVFVIGNTNFANNNDHQKHSKKTHLKNSARTAAAFSSAPRSSPRRTRRPSTFYGPIFDSNQKVAVADSAKAEHCSIYFLISVSLCTRLSQQLSTGPHCLCAMSSWHWKLGECENIHLDSIDPGRPQWDRPAWQNEPVQVVLSHDGPTWQ